MELSYDLAIAQPRYLPKEHKNTDLKGYMQSYDYSSIINNSQIMERSQMSTSWWMNREEVVHTHTHTHTHNGILLRHKKEWNLPIWNDVDRTTIMPI